MKQHVVRSCECLSSIAFDYGHFPETIWNHPDNAELARERDPNLLVAGDVLAIPDLRVDTVSVTVDTTHRFRRRAVPERLKIQLKEYDEPRAGVPYTITLDGVETTGVTDGEGWIDHGILPNARRGVLVVDEEEYELDLGQLAPVGSPEGLEHRLRNLGYLQDSVTDPDDETIDAAERAAVEEGEEPPPPRRIRRALERFQYDHDLEITGMPDNDTRQTLVDEHGS